MIFKSHFPGTKMYRCKIMLSFSLNIFICKQTQILINSTDICIYKQNEIMTKADAYKVILHINSHTTKCGCRIFNQEDIWWKMFSITIENLKSRLNAFLGPTPYYNDTYLKRCLAQTTQWIGSDGVFLIVQPGNVFWVGFGIHS